MLQFMLMSIITSYLYEYNKAAFFVCTKYCRRPTVFLQLRFVNEEVYVLYESHIFVKTKFC